MLWSETYAKAIFRFFQFFSFNRTFILNFWDRDFCKSRFRNANQWNPITNWLRGFNQNVPGVCGRSPCHEYEGRSPLHTNFHFSEWFFLEIFFRQFFFLRIIWSISNKNFIEIEAKEKIVSDFDEFFCTSFR